MYKRTISISILHNGENHNLHILSNIIEVTESRRMKEVRYKIHMSKARNAYEALAGKSEETVQLEDKGVDGTRGVILNGPQEEG
jgi:hypothetical protein